MPIKRNVQLEIKTFRKIIGMYCRAREHEAESLCADCSCLLHFIEDKLSDCPYGPHKFACRKCPKPCYDEAFRLRLREIMRYAGPRMMFWHPYLTVRHILAGMGKKPADNK